MAYSTALLAFFLFVIIGYLAGYITSRILKRKVFGSIWGASIAGVVGASLGAFVFDWPLVRLMDLLKICVGALNWLMKNADTELMPPVNLLAAAAGAALAIYILRRLSPQSRD